LQFATATIQSEQLALAEQSKLADDQFCQPNTLYEDHDTTFNDLEHQAAINFIQSNTTTQHLGPTMNQSNSNKV
jgi:hypothetical protein